MLKIAGCAVAVFCSAVWGYEKSKTVRFSVRMSESLRDLVKRIGDDIDVLCRPLDEIYSTYSDEILEGTGFLDDLRENGFLRALDTVSDTLPAEAMQILIPFAMRLGGGDRESETALCKRTVMLLTDLIDDKKEKLPEKMKMYRVLPLLCALSVVILIM